MKKYKIELCSCNYDQTQMLMDLVLEQLNPCKLCDGKGTITTEVSDAS